MHFSRVLWRTWLEVSKVEIEKFVWMFTPVHQKTRVGGGDQVVDEQGELGAI